MTLCVLGLDLELGDPLNAMNVHVGRSLSDTCICGLLCGATRVLVSSPQPPLLVPALCCSVACFGAANLASPLVAKGPHVCWHSFDARHHARLSYSEHSSVQVTHQTQYLPAADHIAVLQHGRISAQGGYSELFYSSQQPCITQARHILIGQLALVQVTHQTQYLPAADHIAVLQHGRISAQGGYSELLAQGVDFASIAATAKGEPGSLVQLYKQKPG